MTVISNINVHIYFFDTANIHTHIFKYASYFRYVFMLIYAGVSNKHAHLFMIIDQLIMHGVSIKHIESDDSICFVQQMICLFMTFQICMHMFLYDNYYK